MAHDRARRPDQYIRDTVGSKISHLFRCIDRTEAEFLDLLSTIPQHSRSLISPVALLIAGWICLYWLPALDPAWERIFLISPYISAIIGMLLAVHFNRGRSLFLLLNLMTFYWCYRTFLASGIAGPEQEKLFYALCCLLPTNALVVTALKERGAFSETGKLRLIALAGEGLFAYVLFHYNYFALDPYFAARFRLLEFVPSLSLPHLVCTLFALAAIGMAGVAVRRKNLIDVWFFGYLLAVFFACNGIHTPHATTIFNAAACLMLIAAILQESYNMAFRDELTGIASRRALNEELYGLNSEYAIAMVDVDHFKKFNDTYGHEVGDQVLKLVAKKIAAVGGNGKSYRYGGEEFTIVFGGQSVAGVAPHLEHLRQEIAGYKMIIRGTDRPKDVRSGKKRATDARSGPAVQITVSIGVAEHGKGLPTPEEVIIAADKALYRAKQQGRDQVCLACIAALLTPSKGAQNYLTN